MYQSNDLSVKQYILAPLLTLAFVGLIFGITQTTSTANAETNGAYPFFQEDVVAYHDTITNSKGTFGESMEDPSMIGYKTLHYKTGYTLDHIEQEDITTWYEKALGNKVIRHHHIYKTW